MQHPQIYVYICIAQGLLFNFEPVDFRLILLAFTMAAKKAMKAMKMNGMKKMNARKTMKSMKGKSMKIPADWGWFAPRKSVVNANPP